MNINLTGDKIRLINSTENDIETIACFEVSNSQFVNQYSCEKHRALLVDKDCLHISVRRIDNDMLIGHVLVFGITDINKVLELRRITITDRGLGFGREAIILVKKLCFAGLRFHRLWLDVYDDNEKAIKLYESEGFIREGILRDSVKSETGYRSQRIYSMLENEYRALNAL